MSTMWAVVVAVGVCTMAIKGAGPLVLGGRDLPPRVMVLLRLLAPAVLAALVATQTFVDAGRLLLDARAVALVVAFVALLLRVPTLAVVILAAVVTALLRALA